MEAKPLKIRFSKRNGGGSGLTSSQERILQEGGENSGPVGEIK